MDSLTAPSPAAALSFCRSDCGFAVVCASTAVSSHVVQNLSCVYVCDMVSMKLSCRCVCVLGTDMSKGLSNLSGENNCYVNSTVQVCDSTLTDCQGRF